jgi:hypothetical protein
MICAAATAAANLLRIAWRHGRRIATLSCQESAVDSTLHEE